MIERAKIILLAFEKKLNREISHIVTLNPQQIGLYQRRGLHIVSSVDEQTGIQALERIAADKLPRPGQVARLELSKPFTLFRQAVS